VGHFNDPQLDVVVKIWLPEEGDMVQMATKPYKRQIDYQEYKFPVSLVYIAINYQDDH
jgi:hypothetical protein